MGKEITNIMAQALVGKFPAKGFAQWEAYGKTFLKVSLQVTNVRFAQSSAK